MNSVHEIKMRSVTETPLLVFELQLNSGILERWGTHKISIDGHDYHGRVLNHTLFDMRAASDGGIDTATRITLTLANADSYMSQMVRTPAFKGAKLTARFVFINRSGDAACEPVTLFRGVANPADEIAESYVRVTFTNRMSLQRILLPETRIQRRCAWLFPSTELQRTEGLEGGMKGQYSPFFRCGYSAGIEGGVGNTVSGAPFTSCDYTRAQCIERGMFDKDSAAQITRRFGGVEFVPSSILVKSYGERGTHTSNVVENEAKYNDFVPLIYGTTWYRPPVVFARNDGNLTHMEVLIGAGEIAGVTKVIVNGFELPPGSAASSPTSTGWFNIVSYGARNGAFNQDFSSATSEPKGDPYGSMAVLSVVVPNRINDGSSLPRIETLINGLKLPIYGTDGVFLGETFTNNPAWVLLDLLRRSGWSSEEIDLASFATTADYCAEPIETTDLHGNQKTIARFQCNLIVRQRRSAADLIRGVRNNAALCLTYGAGGTLRVAPESSFAIQQTTKPAGSNSREELNGGWPAYEFGDGGNGFSDILRRENGEPTLRLWSRSTAESPNRYSVEFQDEFNEYQQDSLSLVDLEDTATTGQEVSASLTALGLPNFNQAGRIIRLFLDRSLRGNCYVQFDAGIRGLGLCPGDLITLSYAKEGFDRQPFRITGISPGLNHRTATIIAQIHEDEWYIGDGGATSLLGGGRQPSYEVGVPRPLLGSRITEDGSTEFEIEETPAAENLVSLSVKYTAPKTPSSQAPAIPFISLSPLVDTTQGKLKGGHSYYYAVSGVSPESSESGLSFLVRADVSSSSDTNTVTLRELSFAPGTTSFRVYRGLSPAQLFQIAEVSNPATTYTDGGADIQLTSPPDQNFDHANFYWRAEFLPPYTVGIHSDTAVGNADLGMSPNEYQSKVVRITEGKGAGQERTIASHDKTVLTLSPKWATEPDPTSKFVICESSWTFASTSQASPVVFPVPARTDATIHICGRAANVHDKECAYELSPVTRHSIGAAGDSDVPNAPGFGLHVPGRGMVEVSGIAFTDLANTHSIQAASCMLHFWNELNGTSTLRLAVAVDETSSELLLTSVPGLEAGALLQIGEELVLVQAASEHSLTVERSMYGSLPQSHLISTATYVLDRRMFILPFARGFFGSPASGSYSHTIILPDVRIAAAQVFVTNSLGNSEVSAKCFTATVDGGLRTLSGGQFSMQVDGPIAIQSNAVPALTVDAAHAVRDMFATVRSAPVGEPLRIRVTKDGSSLGDELSIEPGQTVSDAIDGLRLPPLEAGWKLSLDILAAGEAGAQPPVDLTVTIRL